MSTNNSLNAPFPLSATLGGLGVASPTAHGILVGEGSSAVTPIVLTAGQVLIGTTSSDPAGATITGSGGITVSATTGAINIAGSGGSGISWVDQTTTPQTMAINTAYVSDDGASLITYTLPATAALGSVFGVVYKGAGGWKVDTAAGQSIIYGIQTASTSLASNAVGDCVFMVCTTANTVFTVYNSFGNLTYV